MGIVTVRDLRNPSADMLARVAQGEHVTVTKDGEPVAQVIPLPRKPLNAEEIVGRFRLLPAMDFEEFQRDIDEVIDRAW